MLPINTCTKSIEDTIYMVTDAKPISVTLNKYNKTKFKDLNFAVVKCSRSLYEKFLSIPRLSLGWKTYRIDSTPLPLKCGLCGIIGHSKNHCGQVKIPEEVLKVKDDVCVDCNVQNYINRDKKK